MTVPGEGSLLWATCFAGPGSLGPLGRTSLKTVYVTSVTHGLGSLGRRN